MNTNQTKRPGRMKLIAATVGAGAAVAAATIAVGVASADNQPFVANAPLTTTKSTVPGAESPPAGPLSGSNIKGVSTTATTAVMPAP